MEETNETNAITGETSKSPSEEVDWKQKYDELEKKFASVRVEEGRVRKLDEELKARDKEIAELRAAKRAEDLTSSLSAEDRSSVPDEVLNAAAKLVGNGMSKVMAENDRKIAELKEERAAAERASHDYAMRNFNERIDAKFPKFRPSIGPGGDKESAWKSYLRYNRASVAEAYNSGDFDTLVHHIETFYRDHLGVPVPSASQDGSAAPDPENYGGGANGAQTHGQGKTYTQDEYLGLYDKIEAARSRGDYAEMKRLNAEINNAPKEGRVKNA